MGQPQPPAALTAKSQSASDSEAEDESAFGNGGLGEPDTETDPYLLPVSHEVALEGVCLLWRHQTVALHALCPVSMHLTGMRGGCMTAISHVYLSHLEPSHARPAVLLTPTSQALKVVFCIFSSYPVPAIATHIAKAGVLVACALPITVTPCLQFTGTGYGW